MLKDITLGQFFPGDTPLHKTDPRMKLIITIVYIVVVFLAKSLYAMLATALFAVLTVIVAKINLKTVFKALKPILLVIVFTTIISIFWRKGENLIFRYGIIEIYKEGVLYAVIIALRIASLVVGTNVLLSYTTSPIALTDGLEQLLSPLKKIKIPVHDFAMIMTIALRFIPTLIEETDRIMSAQRSRGANFSSGSLIKRAKALVPIFIPLFASLIRRADELAVAMECRCYTGDAGRTSMNTLKYSARDFAVLAVFALFAVAMVLMVRYLGGPSI